MFLLLTIPCGKISPCSAWECGTRTSRGNGAVREAVDYDEPTLWVVRLEATLSGRRGRRSVTQHDEVVRLRDDPQFLTHGSLTSWNRDPLASLGEGKGKGGHGTGLATRKPMMLRLYSGSLQFR